MSVECILGTCVHVDNSLNMVQQLNKPLFNFIKFVETTKFFYKQTLQEMDLIHPVVSLSNLQSCLKMPNFSTEN